MTLEELKTYLRVELELDCFHPEEDKEWCEMHRQSHCTWCCACAYSDQEMLFLLNNVNQ